MFIRTDACQKITYFFALQVLVLVNALMGLSVLRLVHVTVKYSRHLGHGARLVSFRGTYENYKSRRTLRCNWLYQCSCTGSWGNRLMY